MIGIICSKTTFKSSNLSLSQISNSILTSVNFEDCNLFHTNFVHSNLNNVGFDLSNVEEAIFS